MFIVNKKTLNRKPWTPVIFDNPGDPNRNGDTHFICTFFLGGAILDVHILCIFSWHLLDVSNFIGKGSARDSIDDGDGVYRPGRQIGAHNANG